MTSPFSEVPVEKQIDFYARLTTARPLWLADALRRVSGTLDPTVVTSEMAAYAPAEARKVLAAAGIRDEVVFPTPSILIAAPSLVGYYRLLTGMSQKQFYKAGSRGTGLSKMKSMESSNTITDKQKELLADFCNVMCRALGQLVVEIGETIDGPDVEDLQLLTLGAQFYGSRNTTIGQEATDAVFAAITEIVSDHITKQSARKITVNSPAGRVFEITAAADPDVRFQEKAGSTTHNLLAIEVKGGLDVSNIHNRAGEAEKSHTKAKAKGFIQFWTVIAKSGKKDRELSADSTTTQEWIELTEVLGRSGDSYDFFKDRIKSFLGI